MNAIERGLRRHIPLEKAAEYFVKLKDFGRMSPEDDALMAECIKQAAADQAPQRDPLSEEAPADTAQVDPQPNHIKNASLRFRVMAMSLRKQAADETAPSEDSSAAAIASPTPAAVPQKDDYLANERAGMEAETATALEYTRALLEEARAEAAAATEQAQAASQQVEELTMQQDGHQSQLQAAQQEGQIAQQAAMQQVETANLAASQAMQQAVGASNQALQAKGQEAAAKIEVQGVRSQLFELASQGLPGTEPQLGGEGGAAGGMEPLAPNEAAAAGAEGGEGAPGEEGADPAAEGEAPAEEADPTADAAGAPDSGQNQAGESASADGMPGQEGPTEAVAEAPPGSPQPPDSSSAGPQAASTGGGSGSTPPTPEKKPGQISIKVGSVEERRAKLAAAVPGLFKTASIGAAGIGALAGGALGAGAAGLEAAGHGPDLDKMRAGIAEREAAPKKTGLRGFAEALSLVQEKARVGLGEATRAHPIPATITGGIAGAAMGASAGPRIADLVREAASLHRGA